MIFAAIDIGSNAIRLMIGEVQPLESKRFSGVKKRQLVRVPLRLGASVFRDGFISSEKQHYLLKSMQAFRHLMELHGVRTYKACATSAMREARNGHEVIEYIEKHCNIHIDLISGAEEAQIIRSTFEAQKFDVHTNYLYCDVGGGSTELSILQGGQCLQAESFEVGTVRMLEGKMKPEEWKRMTAWVKDNCKGIKGLVGLGTGGNITKMMKLAGDQNTKMLGFEPMVALLEHLETLSMEDRMLEYGLKVDRADVIVPAGQIFKRVMGKAGVNSIFVPKIGLADGIVFGLNQGILEGHTCEFQDFSF